MKTYLDSVILPTVVGHARLQMSVCAKVDWHPPFVATATARVAVVGYDVS